MDINWSNVVPSKSTSDKFVHKTAHKFDSNEDNEYLEMLNMGSADTNRDTIFS